VINAPEAPLILEVNCDSQGLLAVPSPERAESFQLGGEIMIDAIKHMLVRDIKLRYREEKTLKTRCEIAIPINNSTAIQYRPIPNIKIQLKVADNIHA
jgi:hypothetical protein